MNLDQLCLSCMREGVSQGVCSHCGAPAQFAQDPPFALPLGTILHGRYLTGRVLGCGGFGITYIAADLQDGHRVAVKEYLPNGLGTRHPGGTVVSSCSDAEDFRYGLNQFLGEARTIYNCQGTPSVISVEKLFEENGTAYYVMEYLEGLDLKKHLANHGGRIPYDEALRLLKPIFEALCAVHSRGIVHRDISPDNIYLCSDGSVRLIDFGAARVSLQEKSQSLDVILKRGYAPEEQYRSHGRQGPWTDVYALACTLYRCITGQVPPEAVQRLRKDECVPPAQLCPGLPPRANAAIVQAMSVLAQDRFQTVSEFQNALFGKASNPTPPPIRPADPHKVITSTPAPSPPTSLGKRFAAYLLDNLIIGFAGGAVLRLVLPVSLQLLMVANFLLYFAYGCLFENSSLRATPGKKLMKLRVTDLSGEKPACSAVLLRNLIKYAGTLVIVFVPGAVGSAIGAALVLADSIGALVSPSKQALHDMAAKTLVGAPVEYHAKMVSLPAPEAPTNDRPVAISVGVQCVSGVFEGNYFPLEQKKMTLGRNAQVCNLIFPEGSMGISSVHCELFWDRGSMNIILRDLGSTYGTFVSDGRKLASQQMASLRGGDSFTIGNQNTFVAKIE